MILFRVPIAHGSVYCTVNFASDVWIDKIAVFKNGLKVKSLGQYWLGKPNWYQVLLEIVIPDIFQALYSIFMQIIINSFDIEILMFWSTLLEETENWKSSSS